MPATTGKCAVPGCVDQLPAVAAQVFDACHVAVTSAAIGTLTNTASSRGSVVAVTDLSLMPVALL